MKEKYQIYERMLQLGHNGAAVDLLLDITERSATERNRSVNKQSGRRVSETVVHQDFGQDTQEPRQDTQEPSKTTLSTEHDI